MLLLRLLRLSVLQRQQTSLVKARLLVKHVAFSEHWVQPTLLDTKSDRDNKGAQVIIVKGGSNLCAVILLQDETGNCGKFTLFVMEDGLPMR